MKRINNFLQLKSVLPNKKVGMTFGNFDGVHKGHQHLLDSFANKVKKENMIGVIVTFSPHPYLYFNSKKRYLILNEEDKMNRLSNYENLYLLVLDFNAFQSLSMGAFVDEIKRQGLNLAYLHLGHDFVMGNDKKNPEKYFKEIYPEICIFTENPYKEKEVIVSSTKIRELLSVGDIFKAKELLGSDYYFYGKVVHGQKTGRKIGYPTVNLNVDENQLLPKVGVYKVKVIIGRNEFKGVMNIGMNPTVNLNKNLKIEIHILDFSDEIYDENVKVIVMSFIRDEKKFNSLDDLKDQISKDIGSVDV